MEAFVYMHVLECYGLLSAGRSSCPFCGLTLLGCVLSYASDSKRRAVGRLVYELWICKLFAFGGSCELPVIGSGVISMYAHSIILAKFERCCRSMTSWL